MEWDKFAKEDIANIMLTKEVLADLDDESTRITGYIHYVGADPFTVICSQIRLMNDLRKRKELVLYLDATGQIIRRIPNQPKKSFYYFICLKGQGEKEPPIPVCEMITNDHTSVTITQFLLKLKQATSALFNRPVIPNRIEVDCSWAMITAVINTFCGQNIRQYLKSSWVIATKEDYNAAEHSILHICCSHLKKRFSDRLSKLTNDTNLIKFFLYCFCIWQNTTSLPET